MILLKMVCMPVLKNDNQFVDFVKKQRRQSGITMPRPSQKKIYLNDICPCGSGMKYKKCCGRAKQQSTDGSTMIDVCILHSFATICIFTYIFNRGCRRPGYLVKPYDIYQIVKEKIMIKVLFICHGNILKNPEKGL